MNEIENIKNNILKKDGILHFILAYTYAFFLFAVILGLLFDLTLKNKIFSGDLYQSIGIFMIMAGSVLILWAKKSSSRKNTTENENRTYLEKGPYHYVRNPTHLGLFLMTAGFGLIINSFFSVVFALIAYIFSKIILSKKQNKILEQRHGEVFNKYKKKVKNWI